MAVKKVEEKKTEAVKAAETKAAEAVKAPEVKAEAPKAAKTEKKAAAKKAPAKAAEKKAPAKKAAKSVVKVQFAGAEYDIDAVVEACKADYKTKAKAAVKTISVYVKPEEATAYYVVNDDFSDKVEL